MGTPDARKANYAYPLDLKKTLDEVVGGYEIFALVEVGIPGKEEQYVKAFEQVLAKREKAASYLMANLPWDLFVSVFLP
ncbi:hypothetical protein ACFLVS_00960 [Chloroflexota bacterium]